MVRVFAFAGFTTVGVVASTGASVFTFDDIDATQWYGAGVNTTALVVDWKDSSPPVVWGYRWDDATTAESMLLALVADDERFFAKVATFTWGLAVNGLGYDVTGDGFALSDDTVFTDGLAEVSSPSDGAVALGGDRYAEGWNTGFWSLWTGDATGWTSAMVGVSGMTLSDGLWIGLSFAPNFAASEPGLSIPEPASLMLLGAATLALASRRR
jgi:hypothetical protein